MKISQKQRRQLLAALARAKRGHEFLMSNQVLVCRKRDKATTTLDFTNSQGHSCTPIDKEIGSDLALLHSGLIEIERMILDTN